VIYILGALGKFHKHRIQKLASANDQSFKGEHMMELLHIVLAFGTGISASVKSICPGGRRPPCPDPLRMLLGAFLLGGIATALYVFLFMGKRAFECCDLIAIAVFSYLFTHFFWTLFSKKSET
jgi:hypothetical protein